MENIKRRIFLLEKQNLTNKHQSINILDFIKQHIGLHSTDYLTPYFSLWNRLENFEPVKLFNALVKTKDVIRLSSFRNTLFIIHKDDITATIESTRDHRDKRITEGKKLFKSDVNLDEFEEKLVTTLFDKQMTNKELFEALGDGISKETFRFIVQISALKGLLARTHQRYITDKIIKYGLIHQWIPEVENQKISEEDAIKEIFLRYVKLFGPVCLDDFCWWLPAKKTVAKGLVAELQGNLKTIELNGIQYFLSKDDYITFEKFDPTKYLEPIVNFLPYEDHFPKGYKIRDWYLSEEVKGNLFGVKKFDRGEIRPSIWVNGEAVGRWEYEWIDKKKTAMKIVIPYLSDKLITNSDREVIEQKRLELELFSNEKLVPLIKMR